MANRVGSYFPKGGQTSYLVTKTLAFSLESVFVENTFDNDKCICEQYFTKPHFIILYLFSVFISWVKFLVLDIP